MTADPRRLILGADPQPEAWSGALGEVPVLHIAEEAAIIRQRHARPQGNIDLQAALAAVADQIETRYRPPAMGQRPSEYVTNEAMAAIVRALRAVAEDWGL